MCTLRRKKNNLMENRKCHIILYQISSINYIYNSITLQNPSLFCQKELSSENAPDPTCQYFQNWHKSWWAALLTDGSNCYFIAAFFCFFTQASLVSTCHLFRAKALLIFYLDLITFLYNQQGYYEGAIRLALKRFLERQCGGNIDQYIAGCALQFFVLLPEEM